MSNEKKSGGNQNSGRQFNQKMKPFLVYQYLLHKSDENHVLKTDQICKEISNYDISAEERSVRRDIEAINQAILIANGEASDIHEAAELCKNAENRAIVYDKHRKGFYIQQQYSGTSNIRTIAECISADRFLDEQTSLRLFDSICKNITEEEAASIKESIQLSKTRTSPSSLYKNLELIKDAMSASLNGKEHDPCRIKFQYLKYTIQDAIKRSPPSASEEHLVSPYKLFVNNGFHYLLCHEPSEKGMHIFRVDRMKNITHTNYHRLGESFFKKISLKKYTTEPFGAFDSIREQVTIRFASSLLDDVVECFGTRDVIYGKGNEKYFTATISVAISNQLFGWLCRFGEEIEIVAPQYAREQFLEYIDQICKIYK